MRIGKYDITLKNIKSYIQGNIRYYTDKYGPAFLKLSDYMKEQIAFRELVSNPECKAKGECKCHCVIPEMFYADKTCEDKCYPELMDETTWKNFKANFTSTIEETTYPFDWQSVVANMVLGTRREIVCVEDSTFDAGDINRGTILEHKFTLRNTSSDIMHIDSVATSCYCTTSDYPKYIEQEGEIGVKIDTSDKKRGPFESLITVNYTVDNESKLIFLIVKCNII